MRLGLRYPLFKKWFVPNLTLGNSSMASVRTDVATASRLLVVPFGKSQQWLLTAFNDGNGQAAYANQPLAFIGYLNVPHVHGSSYPVGTDLTEYKAFVS